MNQTLTCCVSVFSEVRKVFGHLVLVTRKPQATPTGHHGGHVPCILPLQNYKTKVYFVALFWEAAILFTLKKKCHILEHAFQTQSWVKCACQPQPGQGSQNSASPYNVCDMCEIHSHPAQLQLKYSFQFAVVGMT